MCQGSLPLWRAWEDQHLLGRLSLSQCSLEPLLYARHCVPHPCPVSQGSPAKPDALLLSSWVHLWSPSPRCPGILVMLMGRRRLHFQKSWPRAQRAAAGYLFSAACVLHHEWRSSMTGLCASRDDPVKACGLSSNRVLRPCVLCIHVSSTS